MRVVKELTGCQVATTRMVPRGRGDDSAVRLAQAIGWGLFPWQEEILTKSAATRPGGRWSTFENVVIAPRQQGKSFVVVPRALAGCLLYGERLVVYSAHEYKDLDVATPILTANRGWQTMGTLIDGDEVYAPDGTPTKVTKAHPVLTDSRCYEVRFDDGQSVVAGSGHLWAVTDRRQGRSRVMTTQEIIDSGVTMRGGQRNRFAVDIAEPFAGEARSLPIDPWLLGYWLGDGTSAAAALTVGESDVDYVAGRLAGIGEPFNIARPANRAPTIRLTDGVRSKWDPTKMRTRLAALGVLGRKHIPVPYATASIAQRRALLAGILDSDGCAQPAGDAMVTFSNERLALDVLSLARGLGHKASLIPHETFAQTGGRRLVFRVRFRAFRGSSPFDMPRKTDRLPPAVGRPTRASANSIVEIVSAPTRPTRCITVAHESASYVVGTGFVPTHNTAQETFLLMREACGHDAISPYVRRIRTAAGTESVEFTNGSRFRIISRTKTAGRGFSPDVLLFDEAFALNSEMLSATIPSLSARPNPQIYYFSTAGSWQSEVLLNLRRRGHAKTSANLGYWEWHANPGDDIRDEGTWRKANPSYGILQTKDSVLRELDSMTQRSFERERLGIWSESFTETAMDEEDVHGCVVEVPRPPHDGRPMAWGVEVAADRSGAAIVACYRDDDGVPLVVLTDSRPGAGWVPDRLGELSETYNSECFAFDARGGLMDLMERAGREHNIVTMPLKYGEYPAACAGFTQAVADRRIHIGRAPDLVRDAVNGTARMMPTGWVWDRRVTTPPLRLIAATCAYYALDRSGGAQVGVF